MPPETSGGVDDWPVESVEGQETDGQQHPAPSLHLLAQLLLTSILDEDHKDVLEHEQVHEHYAGHHPDVQEGDVADLGDSVSDGPEHGGEGEDGRHPHGHSARHCPWGDVEGEVTQDHEESGGDEGLHDVVANVPGQGDLHDDPGVADVIDVRAVVIVKIYTVVELVQSDVRVHLDNNSCIATPWTSSSPETWTC